MKSNLTLFIFYVPQAHQFMLVFLCALRAGSLTPGCKCCKTAGLAPSGCRCCEWVDVSVCRVQTGVATVPAGWQEKPNRLSTERPLVLCLNSSNCVKKLEKQNIIAAVTTHWLPLPHTTVTTLLVFHTPQAHFAARRLWSCRNIACRVANVVASFFNSLYFIISPKRRWVC